MSIRVLGLDPGTAIVGFGLVIFDGQSYQPEKYGVIRTPSKTPLPHRLLMIHEQLGKLIEELKPEHVAVEEVFFARATTTALAVGHARGVILLTAAEHNLPIFEYTPLQVKQAIIGYGGAEKKQIQQFIKNLLRLESIPKPDDAADALAIAICHCNNYRLQSLIRPQGVVSD